MQDDAQHAVHRAVRQALGGAGEVAGGVVHQDVDAAVVLPDLGDHVVNRLGVAHVTRHGEDFAAVGRGHFARGRGQHLIATAGDGQLRAQLQEPFTHRAAQPRAATGNHHDLIFE